ILGIGGGIVLVPVLLWLYPAKPPEVITSISLAVVFCNGFSGSIAYARMRRIDYKSGLFFSLAIIPGATLGALTSSLIPRQLFNLIFGILMFIGGLLLFWYPTRRATNTSGTNSSTAPKTATITSTPNLKTGIVLSFVVGYIATILGIGGGIIHVPAMVHLLNFPVHIATATSHFILTITALSATVTHLINGTLSPYFYLIIPLAIGVVCGAQCGAQLSNYLQGKLIVRLLAIALCFLGIRILFLTL
ncbi:MAG: sulfite exporter TauE/SafE family protein, partial [Candidatus Sumerlaeia bacterium]|nr:sulfite exporter TauE/SafE family protein [Candidatus Sumerlaeia bacterium]